MKLKKLKKVDQKKISVFIFTILCILLISGVILYRTFAIFEVNTYKNVINSTIEDPGNIYFAFYYNGSIQKNMPAKEDGYVLDEEKSYCGVNGNKNQNIKVSINEEWNIVINGVTTSRTKCNLYFIKGKFILGKGVPIVTSGNGLFEVNHENVEGTINDEGFKQTEWRYAGDKPNNYVQFNNELWRIVGLVNVITSKNEVEQRVKIVKNESIGILGWDHKNQWGSNDWTNSHLMETLNGIYYNSEKGECWSDNMYESSQKTECDFSSSSNPKGFNLFAQEMIDKEIQWNIGESANISGILGYQYYNYERGENVGNNREYLWSKDNTKDSSGNANSLLFKSIGLLYPSDYVYSTSGGNNKTQKDCIELPLRPESSAENLYAKECSYNNWLRPKDGRFWTLMSNSAYNNLAYDIDAEQGIVSDGPHTSYWVYPALYLKTNIKIYSGNGKEETPYLLKQEIFE